MPHEESSFHGDPSSSTGVESSSSTLSSFQAGSGSQSITANSAYPPPFHTFFDLPARPLQGQVITVWRWLIESCLPTNQGFKVKYATEEPKAPLANYELSVIRVEFQTRPVLVVLVNNPALFFVNSARESADVEMRQLMQPLLGQFDIETLYGISVFGESGSRFRVYKVDKQRFRDHRIDRVDCDVEPCPTPPDPHVDREPQMQWAQEIGTTDGQRKLLDLFDYVRRECGILESLYLR